MTVARISLAFTVALAACNHPSPKPDKPQKAERPTKTYEFDENARPDGDLITIRERAPTIDSGSTKQGTTLEREYTKKVPAGRTYEGVVEGAAGGAVGGVPADSQGDAYGTSMSGSTSVEASPARAWAQPPADELWVIARAGTAPASSSPGIGSGQLRVVGDETREVLLPLERTDVHARIVGYLASVEVQQRFANPYGTKIEVEYVFPLPANAAVADFVMTIGDRRIRGIVRDRAEAEEIYVEARRAGHVASLLTEERPNIFTQRIANLEPKKRIDVTLTYFNTLPWEDGAFSFAFPMVVGPRFTPKGTPSPPPTVSYLAPDQRSGHRLSLTIELDAGAPLASVGSPTHIIDVVTRSDRVRRITLAQNAVTPDRDFVLRYAVAGQRFHPTFFHDGETFAFLISPPAELEQLPRAPMEMVFVLDCSGSMAGSPLAAVKRNVARALERLGPEDTFQIITFSETSSALGPRPVPANAENLARARRWLASLDSEGGTVMLAGIRAALDYPVSPGRLRLVSFFTDGYIGNEAEILAEIDARLGGARIFSFGAGKAINRYLLEQMAVFGRGAVAIVGMGDRTDDDAAIDAFYAQISHPALADIQIDWNGLETREVFPRRIPDLVVGRPVLITGRLHGKPPSRIRVRGLAGGKPISVEVPVERIAPHPALTRIWARAGIRDLSDRALVAADARPYAAQIKDVALRHGLVSPFTAFIAVDAASQTGPGAATVVPVAVPVPAGVNYDRTVAPRPPR